MAAFARPHTARAKTASPVTRRGVFKTLLSHPRSQTRRNTTFSPTPGSSRPSIFSCRAPLATSARKIRFRPGRRCPRRGTVTFNPAARIFFMASSCISVQPWASPGTSGPNGPLACRQVAVRNHGSALPSPLKSGEPPNRSRSSATLHPQPCQSLASRPSPSISTHTIQRNYF